MRCIGVSWLCEPSFESYDQGRIQFVERTLENVIRYAEQKTGKTLSRNIAFRWITHKELIREGVVETIVNKVFVSEDRIYPCVDIAVVELLDDGTPVVTAHVAGVEPRPFQKNWTGSEWTVRLRHRPAALR